MEIVELGMQHEQGLRDFLREFAAGGELRIPAYFADPDWPHGRVVDYFARMSRGENLPDGWVPCTTLFLVDGDRILGVANLRHRLTDGLMRSGGHVGYAVRPSARGMGHATYLLNAVKTIARDRGFERLLLTCGALNLSSGRVIEKCGGVLADEICDETSDEPTRRYWIAL